MHLERRRTHRYACPAGQRAVLRVRGREVIVGLKDQSAGGFSVVSHRHLRVREDERLLIRTATGWCRTRIVHKANLGRQIVLGLEREDELTDPRDIDGLSCLSCGRDFALLAAISLLTILCVRILAA